MTVSRPLIPAIGAILFAVQPLYIVIELVLAATPSAPYSLRDNTISDLGATTCTSIEYPFGPVPVCSPYHGVMNGAFVAFGVLLALAVIMTSPAWRRTRRLIIAAVLLVVGGVSSAGTGLVPLDRDLELHSVVSLPAFVALPVGVLLAADVIPAHRRLHLGALVAGVAGIAGTVAFLALVGSAHWGGLFERLALWPAYLWLGAAGCAMLARTSQEPVSH